MTLTIERARHVFDYNAEEGAFRRKVATARNVKVGDVAGKAAGGWRIGNVDDERVLAGAAFGGEDAGDGGVVAGVCRQAVDGLGRQTHQAASSDDVGAVRDGGRV